MGSTASFPLPPPFVQREASTQPLIPSWRPPELRGSRGGRTLFQKNHLDHLSDSLWSLDPRAAGRGLGLLSSQEGWSEQWTLPHFEVTRPQDGSRIFLGSDLCPENSAPAQLAFQLRMGRRAQVRVHPLSALFTLLLLLPSPTLTGGSRWS